MVFINRVAIGASGSWPALNIAVYAAAETLQLRPTVVLSCGSSQYGANSPDMMWVDMERELFDAELISFRATAVSLGGLHDSAAGMAEASRGLMLAAIGRNQVPLATPLGSPSDTAWPSRPRCLPRWARETSTVVRSTVCGWYWP